MFKTSRVPAALCALLGAASMSALLAPLASATSTPSPTPHPTSPAGHRSVAPLGEAAGPQAPVIVSPFEREQFNQAPPPLTVGGVDAGANGLTLYEWEENEFRWIPIESTSSNNGDGTWSLSPTHSLAPGWHTLQVTQTVEVEGEEQESSPSEAVQINIDADAPTLEVASVNGSVTDNEPLFSARGGLGNFGEDTKNKIAFYIDGAKVAAEAVEESGNAYYVPATALTDGPHTAYAVTIDDEGHESAVRSSTVSFTVHTTPAPVITAPSPGASLTTNTPTVTMTGPPNGTVSLFLDENWVADVPVDAQGTASYTFTSAIAAGQHTLAAIARDADGIYSEFSQAVTFTVNAPSAPQSQPAAPQSQPQPKRTAAPPQPQRVTLSSHTLTQSQPVKLGFIVLRRSTVKVTLMRLVHHHWVTVGTVSLKVKAGHGSYKLKRRFGGHMLAPGSYQVSLQTQSGHAHSKAIDAPLSVR